jgi:hypothetical protein
MMIAIGVALACLVLLLIVISVIARYVSETSLVRMVDKYEATEEKLSFRQGFRLGWSRTAFRLFLIDVVLALAVIAVMIPLLLITGAPLLLWTTNNNALGVAGTVASVGILVLVIFVAILAGIVLALFTPFFRRVCVLEERGVIESIRRGFALVRQRPGDVLIMGLLQFGISLLGFIVMIPVLILLLVVALVVAGLPAAIAGGIASLFDQGATPWIVAAFVGAPVFLLVVAAPSIFLNGLLEVFQSGIWTLAYRELLALETAQGEVIPTAADPMNIEKDIDHNEEQAVL